MAAIAAVDGLVPDKKVRAVAQRFTGVEHRIELVRELDGVKYYNDSIGTSPTRTMACLDSFNQKLILIAGGYDKGVPFTQLGVEIIKKVKTLILTGDTAPAIRKAVEEAEGYRDSGLKLIETEDLSAAVAAAQGPQSRVMWWFYLPPVPRLTDLKILWSADAYLKSLSTRSDAEE